MKDGVGDDQSSGPLALGSQERSGGLGDDASLSWTPLNLSTSCSVWIFNVLTARANDEGKHGDVLLQSLFGQVEDLNDLIIEIFEKDNDDEAYPVPMLRC